MKPHVCPKCDGDGLNSLPSGPASRCKPCGGSGIVWKQDSVVNPPVIPTHPTFNPHTVEVELSDPTEPNEEKP